MTVSATKFSEVQSTSYTEDELANLPQTDKVFDRPAMEFNNHDWRQEGYMITDVCTPSRADCHHVGIPIPVGKMLVKRDGRYQIIAEGGQPRA